MQGPFLAKTFPVKAFLAKCTVIKIISAISPHCLKHPRMPGAPFFIAAALMLLLGRLFAVQPVAALPVDFGAGLYARDYPVVPAVYGEIIYRINEKSPKQLYIIGIGHRDPASGANNTEIVRAQAEIFRIGEWLNRHVNLELLLPEGYFSDRDHAHAARASAVAGAGDELAGSGLNNLVLFEKLADETRFVNAEMLLMEHVAMRASQVENRGIYNAVRESLAKLRAAGFGGPSAQGIAELRYLQEIRTAMLMQKIPAVIEHEVLNGAIRNRAAMFTIGLNHLYDIVRYIEGGEITVSAPLQPLEQKMLNYPSELNLLKEGYGITVIIPRTLADNRSLLRLTNLDRIFLAKEDVPGLSH